MTIRAKTTTGHRVNIPFVNAGVQMPILSIAKLSTEHDTSFGLEGGELKHRVTGETVPFVKRGGVYFMQIAVKRSLVKNTEPFGRSGK